MAAGVETPSNQIIEQERRRIGRHLDEIARIAETDIPPSTFYGEVLKRLLDALAAPAGAVWLRTTQGTPQLHYQISLNQVGTERDEKTRLSHEELLLAALHQSPPQPISLMPNTTVGPPQEGRVAPGNPTSFLLLLVPIVQDGQVVGLLEVFQGANRPQNAVQGFISYMGMMADLCARYLRNQRMSQLTGQQQLWTQLETFARQIHGSLNPSEVSYLIANEGRRLVECDRVSVGIRYGRKTKIEAVSGADVVEKRSNLVKLMRTLCDRVLAWGEKLVFQGTQDDSLPPKVLQAMNEYLHESNSKLLVVQPLKDEREGKDNNKPGRAALVMECFDPPVEVAPLLGRLEVVSRHATSALYNAVEYRRIPMRFLWLPLAKAQEGVGGKAKAIWMLVTLSLTLLIAVMVMVPYQLKMDATGQLVPVVRRKVYTPVKCTIKDFFVDPEAHVPEDGGLALLYEGDQQDHVTLLNSEIIDANKKAENAELMASTKDRADQERQKLFGERDEQRRIAESKQKELQELIKRTSMLTGNKSGFFLLKAPLFSDLDHVNLRNLNKAPDWTILTHDYKDQWLGRQTEPSQPVMSIGIKEGPWELELRIPEKHIGQVKAAYISQKRDWLWVDFLLRSDPTTTYRGILRKDRVASEATSPKDESAEAEPVVLAFVDIEDPSIPDEYRLPHDARRTAGTEVHGKIRCGDHAMGYSLFYGVWEFVYEKIVFFF